MQMIAPIRTGTLKVVPVTKSIQIIPVSAKGSAVTMINGWVQDWKLTTINRKQGHRERQSDIHSKIRSVHSGNFQCHRTAQIDVERFVSDTHRTATQLDRCPVCALYEFI